MYVLKLHVHSHLKCPLDPDFSVERANSQWRETCALAGSMAESLMLGAATYVECMRHSRAIAEGTEPSGMAIAQRYLADNAVETAVSVGHRLINFVVRVARTVPSTRELLGEVRRFELLGSSYVPFDTDDPDAWLALNSKAITSLRGVLPEVHHRSLDALDELAQSLAWNSAHQIRAENFHRWRKEHESVVGVDKSSGSTASRPLVSGAQLACGPVRPSQRQVVRPLRPAGRCQGRPPSLFGQAVARRATSPCRDGGHLRYDAGRGESRQSH